MSDGRVEKRAAVEVSVHLVPIENVLIAEITTMVNVSRRGACVLSGQRWRRGEKVKLTTVSGEFQRNATVVYCQPRTQGQFCVGLDFDRDREGLPIHPGQAWPESGFRPGQ